MKIKNHLAPRRRGFMIKSITAGVTIALATQFSAASADTREVRVYNWEGYIPQKIIDDFEKKTGIDVNYDVFDNAEILYQKLLTGNSGYDVVFPTHAQIPHFIQAKALQPLDKEKLPNWKHLDPKFLEKLTDLDPDNKYSTPYLWGTTTIIYNVDAIKKAFDGDLSVVNSWDLIFKPENISRLKDCGVAFLDAPQEIYPIALNYLGLDPYKSSKQDFEKAQELLLSISPNIRYFNSSRYTNDLASGEICAAVGWSGGMVLGQAIADEAQNGIQLGISLPKERALFWVDDMAVPVDAPHPEEAHEFINYILDPEVIAEATNYIGYPNPNKDSAPYVNPEVSSNKNLFIPEDKRDQIFLSKPLPLKTQRMVTRYWSKVTTRN